MTTDERGLRLMLYDRTCVGPWYRPMPGLTHAWWVGGKLFSSLRRFDGWFGIASWEEGFERLATFAPDRPIAEVQYWGHGKWGQARAGDQVFGRAALSRGSSLHAGLRRVAGRMLPLEQGTWWFRTCETFGARAGQDFARGLADELGCRIAGHTYIIGPIQSGLHTLQPGADASWPDDEGLRLGDPMNPQHAYWSRFSAPNTITCFHHSIPAGY